MDKNDFDRLRCPRCQRLYKNKDRVFLDEMNTVLQRCYRPDGFPIKDRGTYREIIEKYEFFHELI